MNKESLAGVFVKMLEEIEDVVNNEQMPESAAKGIAARVVLVLAESKLTYGQAYSILDIAKNILHARSLIVSI